MLKQKIKVYCHQLGLDVVGFIPCRRFDELVPYLTKRKEEGLENEFEEKEIEKRVNPSHYMPTCKTIITIAFPYKEEAEGPASNGFSIYTQRGDYHRVVGGYMNKIVAFIASLGGQAMSFTDSNTLPERYLAYLSGIGFIGRNNMLITKRYGSYVFLGEILTDLEIDCKDEACYEDFHEHKECGACERCLKICPSKAITKEGCNPNICLSYLTQKKELTDEEIGYLKGNVFGCDFCQVRCPYNEQAEGSLLEDFKRLDYMNEEISQFAGMNNAFFKEKISSTSCGWRGKNVIKRNAIIRLHRQGKDITPYQGDSPYINGYIERLLNKEERKDQ